MESKVDSEKIRFPKIFDYAVDLAADLDIDIRETNKLKKETMRKIVERVVLWILKQEYYSDESVEKLAKELDVPAALVRSAVNIVLVVLPAYCRRRISKDVIVNETEKGGLSKELVDLILEVAEVHSSELQATFSRNYYYSAALDRISWRIDMKMADTKKNDDPEMRIFVDMEMREKGKEEHWIFEMRENDIFILTKALGDIVSEMSKIRQKFK